MNYKRDSFSFELPVTRDPAVATSLSVIPGLGQIYNSEPRKGLLFLLVGTTNVFLLGLLSWSHQLVSGLSTLSHEFNIRPNDDIVNALSNFHPGSPSMTMLFILFVAFIGYAMRDAYDRAKTAKRNAIYAPVVMHMDEASSGSYLFHAALMATLVLFAFFFLLPTAPKAQVIDIQFLNPPLETKVKQKTKNQSVKNAESIRDPKLKNIVKNPSQNSNTGSTSHHRESISKPTPQNKPAAPSKPAEATKATAPTKAEPVKNSTPAETKPATSAPAQSAAKPHISPIPPQSASSQVPNPVKPPILRPVAAPLMPELKAPSPQKSSIDPAKMLEGLMPISAPSIQSQVPTPSGVAVKSSHGAPVLVASNIAPANFNQPPQPGIALPAHSVGAATPNVIDTGSRLSKNNHGTGGPSPTGASRTHGDDLAMVSPVGGDSNRSDGNRAKNPGPSTSPRGPVGNDDGALDKFLGQKPSIPGRDKAGGENGERGTTDHGKIGNPQAPGKPINVDFTAYMLNLQRRIKRAWLPPRTPTSKMVTVRFNISRNGSMRNLKLSVSSGSTINDDAALKAVSNAAPFAPLPEGSPEDVDIEFKFDYKVFNSTGAAEVRRF